MSLTNLSGMFQAEVLDTDQFTTTGKIKVHILGSTNQDVFEMVGVMTPFGGLPNMGMQALPPIGAIGLVMYIREKSRHPVWIGSLLRYWQDEEEKELDNGIANPVEAENPEDFVIKTQYTTLEDQELSSDSNRVENVIKMNKEVIRIAKVNQSDGYKYQDGVYTPDDENINVIEIKDETIKIKLQIADSDEYSTLEFGPDGPSLVHVSDGGNTYNSIVIRKDGVQMDFNGDANIVIKEGKVLVNADKIELNGTDGTGMFYEGYRDFVNQAFNTHVHGTPSGPSSPPTSPFTGTATAESQNVKLS